MSARASGYVKAMTICPNGERITPREKLVGMVLADSHQDRAGRFTYPSVDTIAEESVSDRRTCQRYLAALERKGVIRRLRPVNQGRGTQTFYFFPELDEIPEGWQDAALFSTPIFLQKGDRRAAEGRQKGGKARTGVIERAQEQEQKQQKQLETTPPNPLANEGECGRKENDAGKTKESSADVAGSQKNFTDREDLHCVSGSYAESSDSRSLPESDQATARKPREATGHAGRSEEPIEQECNPESMAQDAIQEKPDELAQVRMELASTSARELRELRNARRDECREKFSEGTLGSGEFLDRTRGQLTAEQLAHLARCSEESRKDFEAYYREENRKRALEAAKSAEVARVEAERIERLKAQIGTLDKAVSFVMRGCGFVERSRRRGGMGAIVRDALQQELDVGNPLWEPAPKMVEAWVTYVRKRSMMRRPYGPQKFIELGLWRDSNTWPWDEEKLEQLSGASVGSV
jgi:hypothetical protein